MATTALGDDPAHTTGELPAVGEQAPDFTLVDTDLKEFSLADLPGRKVLSIFPSIGTGVCQASVREFNKRAAGLDDTTVLNISVDLPFALAGFCAAEGIEDVKVGSAFRSSFAEDYGVRLTTPSSRVCSPGPSWSWTPTARSCTPSWCPTSARSPTTTRLSPR